MRKALLLWLGICGAGFAQLPDYYRNVSRVTWVVRDVQAVIAQWRKFGLAGIEDHGSENRSAAKVRRVSAWLGNVMVDFIQPQGGINAYTEFLSRHGEGILSLMHRAESAQQLEAEVTRMKGLGVGVLQRGEGYVIFDTAPAGKYNIGVFSDAGTPPSAQGTMPITQFAFVVKDWKPVSDYWQKLGFPAMTVTHSKPWKMFYRDKPASMDLELAWQRQGKVPYEWCVVPPGRSVYSEYLEKHGEGVQHLGFRVDNIDSAIARFQIPVAQSGGWGEEGKKGSGRFAYLDTEPKGGITVELLWNFQ